ncbi:Peptidyl-prolyl cis-trans isomerase FKBP3 [Lamellibrachia satsuma]|nr:Peptidyl-prolyl cis-trans isomerase FKBP3 [Lamellibrachia satsuma]
MGITRYSLEKCSVAFLCIDVIFQVPPKYSKYVLKKGNKINYPRPGDTVLCYYIGKMPDGTVFDTNSEMRAGQKKKKQQPLKFKVGTGQVIRGWDEGIQKMSLGETAELRIEAEWAYGRKGLEGKIPPNSALVFEVELVGIE